MGWKYRRGHICYYKSVRKGGKVLSRYWGRGMWGAFAAKLDAESREKRQLHYLANLEVIARMEGLDRLMKAYCGGVDQIACEAIEAAGYVRHHRGEWRKSRGRSEC